MLRLEKISKVYPTGEVLKDVSWEIKNGERIGQKALEIPSSFKHQSQSTPSFY